MKYKLTKVKLDLIQRDVKSFQRSTSVDIIPVNVKSLVGKLNENSNK